MSSLQDRRVWLGGGALTALLIVAVGWFFLIGPERSSTSDLRDQAAAVREQNDALQSKVTTLKQKSAKLGQYTNSLKQALEALPADSGLPAFTRQLSAQAAGNAVKLTSVTVGGISSLNSTAPAAATTDDTAATDGASTPTPAPSATPAPTTTADAGATPAPAASGASGIYSVQVSIESTGALANQLQFLHDIQTAGPRRALITSTQFAPGTGAKAASTDLSSTVTTQLTVFSAPQSPAQMTQLKKLLSGKIGN